MFRCSVLLVHTKTSRVHDLECFQIIFRPPPPFVLFSSQRTGPNLEASSSSRLKQHPRFAAVAEAAVRDKVVLALT